MERQIVTKTTGRKQNGSSSKEAGAKERYRRWCESEPLIPIFSQPWWLDAVCTDGTWDVIVIEEKGVIVATLPLYIRQRGPFSSITMPRLTPTLGPYITCPSDISHWKRLSWEMKILDAMIRQMPRTDRIVICCHYKFTNWLPFYWAGYKQQTAYTYMLPDLSDLDRVFAGFASSRKRNIRRAQKLVRVGYEMSPEAFYEHRERTLRKKGRKTSYSFELLSRIYYAAYARGAGRVIIHAEDSAGRLHAALFVVWAPEGAYNLISTIDPNHRDSGAGSLLFHDVIRYVASFTNRFDFEGSMIESVEGSYRRFGSLQTPYFILTKTPSRLLRVHEAASLILRSA